MKNFKPEKGLKMNSKLLITTGLIVMISGFSTAADKGDLPKLPSGPSGPGVFGAYYTHLEYNPQWDKSWRVGPHSDVVVRFDDFGYKFVFWRGTSYIPCWVTETDIWYTNEFVERRGHHSPNTRGCVEPMSDKQCRFSHVRIIESNDARVVVHWRYAPVDVGYNHPFIDPLTGWGDWVDEYYTIYPDGIGVRKITVHTTRPDLWTEYQEAIVVNQPGTMPDDNIELGAVSLANMRGESKTYYWTEDGGPEFGEPEKANILKINLKAKHSPFAIAPPPEDEGVLITPYEGHGRRSHFNWWNHWPVSQAATDGRAARSADRPSHSSLCHIGLEGMATATWKHYEVGENMRTKIMLHGMTDKQVAELVPLAKSWLYPANLKSSADGFVSQGYDQTQMAYEILCNDAGQEITVKLAAGPGSPVVNPAFVVKNFGQSDVAVKINGKSLKAGRDFRAGHRHALGTDDLIVWIKTEHTEPFTISLIPD